MADTGLRSGEQGVDQYPQLIPVWSCGAGTTEVVRIAVVGEMTRNSMAETLFAEESSVEKVLRQIRAATEDEHIRGIILEIDSPGGDVTAADEIHHALQAFKRKHAGRVILALFGDLAASGAYYIACAADYIVAQPTAVTGSIGVMISSFNLRGLGQKLGVESVNIKSGVHKDLLNPLETMTPEQRALLQEIVDSLHQRFVRLVAEGRHLPLEQARALADGRIFHAAQAMELKLVDSLGYWDEAVAKSGELLGETSVKVIRYTEPFAFPRLFRALERLPETLQRSLRPRAPRLQYLWAGLE
jgi:protease-4